MNKFPLTKISGARTNLKGRSATLGLSAGALGMAELAKAADAEAPRTLPTLLLPDHYRINDDGTLVFSLESGEQLSLIEDQYLVLDSGLLLIVDELAQNAMAKLPVMGSLRTELLTEVKPVRGPDGAIVEVSSNQPLWSGEGPALHLFEKVDLQTYEIAQSTEAAPDAADGISGTLIGGAGLISGLGALLSLLSGGAATVDEPSNDEDVPSSPSPLSGTLTKGPLSNAFVFIDTNANGVHDPDEPSTTTDASGNFSFPADSPEGPLVAVTTDATIDTASGTTLAGMTFRAPAGASVITPLTTLMEESGLDADQLKASLGLPANIDPLTFNPFAAGANAADALAVEKLAVQVTTALGAFSAAAEGAGADPDEAFAAAVAALSSTLQSKQSGGTILDLTDSSDLASMQTVFTAQANSLTGIDTAKLSAVVGETTTAIENVNDAVAAITNTDLSDQSTADIFGLLQVLQDQVEDAAETGGSIELTDPTKVDDAAGNAAPLDIRLAKSVNPVTDTSLTIGWLTTKDEETADPNFKYELLTLPDSDHGLLDVDPSTGRLSLKSSPVAGTTYDFTVKANDEGGKSFSKAFNIQISPPHDYSILDHDPFRTNLTRDGYFFKQSHVSNNFSAQDTPGFTLNGGNGIDYASVTGWVPFLRGGSVTLNLSDGENYTHYSTTSDIYDRHFYNGGEDRDFIYTSKGNDRFELANRIFNVGNGENYFELDLGISQGFDFEYKGGSGQDTVKSGGYWFGANAYINAYLWRRVDFGLDDVVDSLYLNDSFTFGAGEMPWYLKNFNPYHDKIFISGDTPQHQYVSSYSIDFPGYKNADDWNSIILQSNYHPSIIQNAIIYTEVPKFNKGKFASYSIAENTKFVLTQPAIDPDGELLTYSRRLYRDGSLFEIDEKTGTLNFKSAPDFEVPRDFAGLPGDNIYEVEVVAEDPNGATATQVVSITVTDANVTFTGTGTGTLVESTSGAAYTVSASDQDASSIAFDVVSGKDAGLFDLDPNSGVLTFKSAPDYESPADVGGVAAGDNIYEVDVRATASTGETATQTVSVTVTNTNDNALTFTGTGTGTLVENTSGAAYTVAASDQDASSIAFSLVSGKDAGLFDLDPNSGVLNFKSPPDYEIPADAGGVFEDNIYEVDVRATATTGETVMRAVSVTVTNAPELWTDADVDDNATVFIGADAEDLADFVGFTAASASAEASPLSNLGKGSGNVATITLGNGDNYLNVGENAASDYGRLIYTGGTGIDQLSFGDNLAGWRGQASIDLGLDTVDDRVEFLGQVANVQGSVVDIYNFDVTDNDIITVPFSYDLLYYYTIGAYLVRDSSFEQGQFIVHGYGPGQSTLLEANIVAPGGSSVVGDNDVADSATVSIIGKNIIDDFIGFSAASLTATDPLSYLGSGSGSVATITLGNGRNYLRGGDNAAQGGQVIYTGGAGLDDIEFGSYLAVSPNGQASFDLGDGTNTFSAGSSVGYYSGVFGYTGGSGNDTVTLGMSVGGAGGAATFTMGNGSNTLSLGDLAAGSGGLIQYTGGTGEDTISFGDMFASSGSATVDLGSDTSIDTITFQGNVYTPGTASPVLIQNFDPNSEDRLVLESISSTTATSDEGGVTIAATAGGVRITANQGMIDLKVEGTTDTTKFSVQAAATGVEIV